MAIIDISRPLASGMAVWPGDQPYEPAWTMRIADGDPVNVSAVTLSPHTGTHADAPYHVDEDGRTADALAFEAYVGRATVIDRRGIGSLAPEDLADLDLAQLERLLIKTETSDLDGQTWPERFLTLDPDLADRFGQQGLKLVGLDTPSVDPRQSTTLDAHHILARHGVAHLENLWLRDVPPGDYWLSALPLRLNGLDAAPVRAVLMTLESGLSATIP